MEIIDPHKKKILSSLKKEKVVLFIGAGCSKECGIPDSKGIVDILKTSFGEVDFQNDTFLDVCYDIVETPPYTKTDILNIIKPLLKPKNESLAFEILPKIPFGAIFTTNYDTLIEDHFGRCSDKPYECWTVKGLRPREPIQSRNYTMVYKLMGSIDSEELDNGGPILTRAEYQNSILDTERYYERLQDAVLDGVLIFIGYSLKDINVIYTLDKLRDKMKDNLPYSYFISPNATFELPRLTKFHERRIIGFDGTFKDFIIWLHKNMDDSKNISLELEEHCKINDINIPISKTDFQVHKDEFDLITNESLERPIISDKRKFIEDFFRGKISDWSPYSLKLDFIRDIYYDGLWNSIQKELKDKRSQANKIIFIHGMPGCGKSTLIKRLGFDIYQKQGLPVIYLKNTGILFENRYINKVITFLWEKYTDLQESPGLGEEVKFTIIIDNLGNHTQQIVSLFRHLKSRGKPCLFIVTERSRDWENIKNAFPIRSDDIIEFIIPDQLKDNELDRIIKYLYNLEYIEDDGKHWNNTISEIFDKSFFITIYSIVRHSRKPLEEIISDQYLKLTSDLQKMFLYISVVDQFDGDINVELLVRALKKSYGIFEEELVSAESDGVFFRHELQSGYLTLKTHHKIIAKKTIDFFASDPEKQKEMLKDIISNIFSSSEFEINLGMYLVIDCFGPNARDKIFSLQQKEELLETFLKIEDNKVVRHHLGIVQKKLGPDRYQDSYLNLIKALEMPKMYIAGRVEFNTNILTSLGDLFTKMALQDDIDDTTFNNIIEDGEKYLCASIDNDSSNIHAYHAYANLLKLKAVRFGNDPESLTCYIEALKQAEIGLTFSPENDNPQLNYIKIEILKHLQDLNIAEEYADEIYEKNHDVSGYYIIVRLLLEDYNKNNDEHALKNGLKICDKALKFSPVDYNLLVIKLNIVNLLDPMNNQYQHQILTQIISLQIVIPLYLKFRYAYISFILHYYPTSKKVFRELRDLSAKITESSRYVIREWMEDENGKKLLLQGEIERIMSNKFGIIRVLDLPGLEWPIPYSPLETKENLSVGTPIWFNLGFSYAGPIVKNPTRRV